MGGYRLGEHWEQIRTILRPFDPLFAVVIVILIALYWLQPIRKLAKRRIYRILTARHKGEEDPLDNIIKIISDYPSFYIRNINYEHEISSRTLLYRIRIFSTEGTHWRELVRKLSGIQGMLELKWEESDVP